MRFPDYWSWALGFTAPVPPPVSARLAFLRQTSLGRALIERAEADGLRFFLPSPLKNTSLGAYYPDWWGLYRPSIHMTTLRPDVIPHELAHHDQHKKIPDLDGRNPTEWLINRHLMESDARAKAVMVMIQAMLLARRQNNEKLSRHFARACQKNRADATLIKNAVDTPDYLKNVARQVFTAWFVLRWEPENESYLDTYRSGLQSQTIPDNTALFLCASVAFSSLLCIPLALNSWWLAPALSNIVASAVTIYRETRNALAILNDADLPKLQRVYETLGIMPDGSGNYLTEVEDSARLNEDAIALPDRFLNHVDALHDRVFDHYGVRAVYAAKRLRRKLHL